MSCNKLVSAQPG